MSIKIITDSASNIYSACGLEITSVPLKIITDEKEYVDNEKVDVEGMLKDFDAYKGTSSTACPSSGEWYAAFGDAKEVICVTITSALSGSYQSAMMAKQDYEEKHPDRKVFVLDTLSAGPEMAMVVEKLAELVNQGKGFEEVVSEIKKYMKRTHLCFMLESLKNFARNGRVKPVVAQLVGVLGIRVVGIASAEGTLEPKAKVKGEQRALNELVKLMSSIGYKGGRVRIAHCRNENAANLLAGKLKKLFGDIDISIMANRALCSYYAENGGMLIGYES